MKRAFLFLLLFVVGALIGRSLHGTAPGVADDDRKIAWLARELALTDAQRARVAAIHQQHCPRICTLGERCETGEPRAVQACREATRVLVDAVSAELTAAQRERYHALVASCLDEKPTAHP